MIEVFKTDVKNKIEANKVTKILHQNFSEARINFDLTDCDKILRVDGIEASQIHSIVSNLTMLGIKCETLN